MLIALAFAALASAPQEPVLPRRIARACARRPVPRGPCTDLRPVFEQGRNYPREALRLHQQGVSHYRVRVGLTGRVTACEITRSSGSPSLDAGTCQILRDRILY